MNTPYGLNELINSVVSLEKEREALLAEARGFKTLVVEDRFLSDCEMLSIGGFTPLQGFMNKQEVDSVVKRMQLPSGVVWGIPIVLLIDRQQASDITEKTTVALIDREKNVIALMKVTEIFEYDKKTFCKEVFKTNDHKHPGVKTIMESPDLFVAGSIKLLNRPSRKEVAEKYYLDPIQTRDQFKRRNWKTIVAFQTRNPIHRAHEYLIQSALGSVDGALIHPLVGETKSDDIPAGVRMKCYEALFGKYFDRNQVMLSVLPTFMRYAGPREAINHAIIRKNYGCTHFIIGRDHAGVGDYYGPFEAQELLIKLSEKIGIIPIKFELAFYCHDCKGMATAKTCLHPKESHLLLSGTKVRDMLKSGECPPPEFSRKEVVDILISWSKA
ncbi:sulfate adenylyltransferase [Thermoproteota archaeon]